MIIMKIIKNILNKNTGLLGKVLDFVDGRIPSKIEKSEIQAKITKIFNDYTLKMESELTKRHQYDMTSDSWLSKNIRPMALIFLLVLLAVLIFLDSNSIKFNVDEAYIQLIKTLSITAFAFYFGLRGVEKIFKIKK